MERRKPGLNAAVAQPRQEASPRLTRHSDEGAGTVFSGYGGLSLSFDPSNSASMETFEEIQRAEEEIKCTYLSDVLENEYRTSRIYSSLNARLLSEVKAKSMNRLRLRKANDG